MDNLAERVRFTVPKDVKDHWNRQSAVRGMSLSAYLRDATDDLLAVGEVADVSSVLTPITGFPTL